MCDLCATCLHMNEEIKSKVIELRSGGKSYAEICILIKQSVPKSTLSYWCRNVVLPKDYGQIRKNYQLDHLKRIRELSRQVRAQKRKQFFSEIESQNSGLRTLLFHDKRIAKIAIALLYQAEGSKRTSQRKGGLVFGNSDAYIISLFLELLRYCYSIDNSKLRCTVQCRADQNVPDLLLYWSKISQIPLNQFFKTQIDPRTVGKPTRKLDYYGVCRIEYFSAAVFWDVLLAGEMITGARSLVVKRLHGMQETAGSNPAGSTRRLGACSSSGRARHSH